jgi:hypothetical protein
MTNPICMNCCFSERRGLHFCGEEEIIVDWRKLLNKDPRVFDEECERRGTWPPGKI